MLECQLGVKMTFIPASEHQQNLVEWAHRILWSTLRAIWIISDITTWKTAVQEAVYQYNVMLDQSTGFSPNSLHHGYELASPGLLHPEDVPANPPPNAPSDKIKFTRRMQELQHTHTNYTHNRTYTRLVSHTTHTYTHSQLTGLTLIRDRHKHMSHTHTKLTGLTLKTLTDIHTE